MENVSEMIQNLYTLMFLMVLALIPITVIIWICTRIVKSLLKSISVISR